MPGVHRGRDDGHPVVPRRHARAGDGAEGIAGSRGVAGSEYHRKPSASKPATPEVITALSRDCDYVIIGVGD